MWEVQWLLQTCSIYILIVTNDTQLHTLQEICLKKNTFHADMIEFLYRFGKMVGLYSVLIYVSGKLIRVLQKLE